MTSDLLMKLEQKVSHAVEVIELLRMQVEELEKENTVLKAEHEKWRRDLASLLKRLDIIDSPAATPTRSNEEFMTV